MISKRSRMDVGCIQKPNPNPKMTNGKWFSRQFLGFLCIQHCLNRRGIVRGRRKGGSCTVAMTRVLGGSDQLSCVNPSHLSLVSSILHFGSLAPLPPTNPSLFFKKKKKILKNTKIQTVIYILRFDSSGR